MDGRKWFHGLTAPDRATAEFWVTARCKSSTPRWLQWFS